MAFTRLEIEEKVIKFFIRELKDNNLMHLLYSGTSLKDKVFQMFRCVGQERKYFPKPQRDDSPFRNCNTMESFVKALDMLNEHFGRHGELANEGAIITMSINHLIHFFVENELMNSGSMDRLNAFGQSVFNRTVASLYGHEQVQRYNDQSNDAILPTDIKQKLWKAYLEGCANGEINIGFDAFVANKINEFFRQQQAHGLFNTDESDEYDESDEEDYLFEDDDDVWND